MGGRCKPGLSVGIFTLFEVCGWIWGIFGSFLIFWGSGERCKQGLNVEIFTIFNSFWGFFWRFRDRGM